jgi:hypothetical protein
LVIVLVILHICCYKRVVGFRKQTERVATVTPTVAGEARESATPTISYNVLRLGVCYFALQIFEALDKIYRQNNSTKPLLVAGAVN